MYADMVALIGKLPGQSVSLIGHSIGGAMVIKFAASDEKASSLIKSVIAISPPLFDPTHAPSQSANIFKLPAPILWLLRPLMSKKARVLLFGPKATDRLKDMEREASARNPVYMFKAFYMGVDRNFLSVSSSIRVPGLCIGADKDALCSPEEAEKLAGICHSKYAVANECGHQCMQEDPEQIIGLIEGFLGNF